MPGSQSTGARSLGFFVILGFVQALWPLTMDLYLPAFPQLEAQLATAPGQVQLTLTGAFVGMAIGQLAAGPLSDRVGRMRPLVGALALFSVASLGCAISGSMVWLVVARTVQGLGVAACSVIVLAIVRDCASGVRMLRLLANLQLVNGFFVVTAPAMGALLLHVTDWRGLFTLLAVYGTLATVLVTTTVAPRESLPRESRRPARTHALQADYRALLADRRYIAALAANALLWAGMMGYMASSAFLLENLYKLGPIAYAAVFGGHGGVMILAAQVSSRLAQRAGLVRVIAIGSVTTTVAAGALLIGVLVAPAPQLAPLLVPLFIFTTGFGIVSPSIQALAMQDHGPRAGTAASLLGASTMITGAVAAPLVASFGLGTAIPVATFLALAAAAAGLVTFLGIVRAHSRRTQEAPA